MGTLVQDVRSMNLFDHRYSVVCQKCGAPIRGKNHFCLRKKTRMEKKFLKRILFLQSKRLKKDLFRRKRKF